MLILLSTVLRRVPPSNHTDTAERHTISPALREKLDASITRAASLVYARGFLRKGVGLCHGVAGSVFALLAAADAQPEHAALFASRAIHLAQLAMHYRSLTKRGYMLTPDRPWSLYEGLAGMCCAYGEIVRRIKAGGGGSVGMGCGMPGFDDIVSED